MSSQTSTAMRSAPCSASRTACARPCPRAAPVTRATLPATSPCMVSSPSCDVVVVPAATGSDPVSGCGSGPDGPVQVSVEVNDLGFQVLDDALAPVLPAVAGGLQAAEGQVEVEVHAVVHVHAARPDPPGQLEGTGAVGRVDGAGEPEGRVVGDADRVVEIGVLEHHQDGAEQLLAGDGAARVDVGDDRRLEVEALLETLGDPATGHQGGAVADGLPDGREHPVAVRPGDERPQLRGVVG